MRPIWDGLTRLHVRRVWARFGQCVIVMDELIEMVGLACLFISLFFNSVLSAVFPLTFDHPLAIAAGYVVMVLIWSSGLANAAILIMALTPLAIGLSGGGWAVLAITYPMTAFGALTLWLSHDPLGGRTDV